MDPVGLAMVMVGSAVGGGARYLVGIMFPYDAILNELPVAIIAINILGSLAAGLYLGMASGPAPLAQVEQANLFMITGVLGGFTTFSAFSVQTVEMLQDGEPFLALANVAISVVGAIAAAAIGFMLAQAASA